jgi:hypothetical protein
MTEPDKTPAAAAATKTRGTGFPVISLPAATKIIREAGTYGKVHTANALASYAGHSTANSGAWRAKAAALRDWGLVTTAPTDSFALTDRALEIAHPSSPEDAQKAMLEAFNHCKLYVEIYNDMAKGADLKVAQIANIAVTRHGVAAKSKDAFATSFVESAAAVGLATKVSADVVRLLSTPNTAGDGATDDAEHVQGQGEQDFVPERETPQKRRPGTPPPVVNQIWPLENGQITLTISSNKPFEGKVFVEIGTVIGAIEKLAALAGTPAEEEEA